MPHCHSTSGDSAAARLLGFCYLHGTQKARQTLLKPPRSCHASQSSLQRCAGQVQQLLLWSSDSRQHIEQRCHAFVHEGCLGPGMRPAGSGAAAPGACARCCAQDAARCSHVQSLKLLRAAEASCGAAAESGRAPSEAHARAPACCSRASSSRERGAQFHAALLHARERDTPAAAWMC